MSFRDFWTVVCSAIAAGNRTQEGPIAITYHQDYEWSRDLWHPMRPRIQGEPDGSLIIRSEFKPRSGMRLSVMLEERDLERRVIERWTGPGS